MSKAVAGLVFVAGLAVAACSDGVGPPPKSVVGPRVSLQHLVWSPDIGKPSFAALWTDPVAEGWGEALAVTAIPILDNYQIDFWARQGKVSGVTIRYQAADGSWRPYIEFTVPRDGLYQYPDGRPFGPRDSVLITVRVDTTNLVVHFEPTGLVFNPLARARFKIWYTGADRDLDRNGVVDEADEYIRQVLLGVWVQERPGEPWEAVAAVHDLEERLFAAALGHFSGYAVSH